MVRTGEGAGAGADGAADQRSFERRADHEAAESADTGADAAAAQGAVSGGVAAGAQSEGGDREAGREGCAFHDVSPDEAWRLRWCDAGSIALGIRMVTEWEAKSVNIGCESRRR